MNPRASSNRHRKQVRHYDGEQEARALTFSCYHRRPFLGRTRTCEWMIRALELGRRKHAIHLWAYVVMPEHIHLLVWPLSEEFRVSPFLTTVKQSVSKRARVFLVREAPAYLERCGGEFHFWQDRPGFDRNLSEPLSIWETIDYIHANPVRRKLCEHPEDWVWSSAGWYAGRRDGPLALDTISLPDDPRR